MHKPNSSRLRWATFLFLVVATSARAQEQKLMDKIVAGAKKEGKVKVGLTVRWEEGGKPAAKRIVELFHSRYPFVKVDYERIGGSRERERVLSELAAGRVSYDVAVISSTQVPVAIQANVTEQVDWKALGVHPKHVHQDGVGVYYRTQIYGIAYNRKLVPDSVGKKLTWEDCANPKWKKKIAMDNRPRHLEILWQPHVWGREKTLAHARQLAANQTTFERSRSDGMTKLSLGEYPIFCGATYSTYKELVTYREAKHLGYTLAEPIPVPQGDVVFVTRGAANPNAATLWIVWSLTEEGQKILDAVEFNGSPFVAGTEPAKLLKGKKVVWYEPQYSAKATEILKEIIEAIGLPIVR
ncbi:MAG: ABC transporter substrate-binding protein [Candidatus Binatia bacterium]